MAAVDIRCHWVFACWISAALQGAVTSMRSLLACTPNRAESWQRAAQPSRQFAAWFALAALVLLVASPMTYAQGASPASWRLSHFRHTAYSTDRGAPGEVSSLAQTSDGYLWVAGGQGLSRFDGLKFVPFAPAKGEHLLSSQVMTLLASRDGGLWLGYEAPGASLMKDGHLKHYMASEGYEIRITDSMFEGFRGRLYAVGSGRLLALNDGRWSRVVPFDADKPDKRINAAVADGRGVLWLATGEQIHWCQETDCHPVDTHIKVTNLILGLKISPANVLYVSQDRGPTRRFQIEGTSLTELPALPVMTAAPSFDRHGGVWLPSLGEGVVRLSPNAEFQGKDQKEFITDTFRKADGLTGDYVWPSTIDSEGDVWVGTQDGIDRFREVSLNSVPAPAGLQSPKVVPGARGEAWISSGLPLMRWDGTSLHPTTFGTYAFAMCTDISSGKTWLVYDDGLWEVTGDDVRHVAPAPPGASKGRAYLLACGKDEHLLAVHRRPAGSFEWADGKWTSRPDIDVADMAAEMPDGKFLIGHRANHLLVIDGSVRHEYGAEDGLEIGVIKALVTFNDVVLLGGRGGLAMFKDGHFNTLSLGGNKPFADITGLVFDDSGNLWVHMAEGATRIAGDEITEAIRNPSHPLNGLWLSSVDGMSGVPAQGIPSPSLSKGADGRLWFTSQSSITWLDPGDLVVNPVPPKLRIDALVADGTRYPVKQASLVLPPRPSTIEIDFNAPLLRAADKGQFLYRLLGVDKSWQEAGSNREAHYSNLGPGEHTFQVRAANESGVWNGSEASLVFHIQPAFYETWWFRAICALMVLLAMCFGYMLRIRQVTAKMRIREDERLRIARDLHDTLLQSVQAMLTSVETIKDKTTDKWAKVEAERVADWGRQAVSDGRTKVARLRACDDEPMSPIRETLDIVQGMSESTGMVLRTSVSGSEPILNTSASHEVANVIREISNNAIRHSEGKHLWVSITYGDSEFVAVVKDDGRGIDASLVALGEKSGHWGLKGARERICSLGGTLSIQAANSIGTEVIIRVPARHLYQRPSGGS
ncbi:sensor histidine kinase [Dyella silvae]|uniref:sensor histidine kinase n=1 Tax=Dyella silvae TaxID=2994424 RepID=UPI002263EE68|nr:sensor histidine kinase [Dyella silvae]